MICANCSKEMQDHAKFCGYCGHRNMSPAESEAAAGLEAVAEAERVSATENAASEEEVRGIAVPGEAEEPGEPGEPEEPEEPGEAEEPGEPGEPEAESGGAAVSVAPGEPEAVARSDAASAADEPTNGAADRRQTGSKLLLYLFGFVFLVGVLTGMWGAYYVAKNGWERVPFSEKLSFLPIVKLEKEKTITYSSPVEEAEEEVGEEKKNVGASGGEQSEEADAPDSVEDN